MRWLLTMAPGPVFAAAWVAALASRTRAPKAVASPAAIVATPATDARQIFWM